MSTALAKPTLLILTSEFPPGPGGIGTHAHQLATQLTMGGWNVAVYGPQDYATRDAIDEFNRSQPFAILRPPRRPRRAGKVWGALRAIRRMRPDVILASGEHIVYMSAALRQLHRVPWIAVEHGWIPSSRLVVIKRWAFERADAVISVSNYSGQKLRELGVEPHRLVTIWNGADATRFMQRPSSERGRARMRLGLSQERLLVTVGTVSLRKGQDVVIQALPKILEQHPTTHYVLAGSPDREKDFAAIATRLGVRDRVHFLGVVDGGFVVDLLNDADVALLTSRHVPEGFEGFGIAAIEAAMCGTPSVVTANSGLAEAVLHGRTGLVVPPEDPEALARAVNELLVDDVGRSRLGTAAQARAMGELTWDRVAEKYANVLRAVIGARRSTDDHARSAR